MPIRQLPQSLINKIAAGEVIERPASVVKELMENAVDAKATRIDVSVGQGGLELIRVADNGCGIPAAEIPLALASHATSKLAEADDLFRIHTLGFRGEALASVAEISRLRLRSRTADSAEGAELEVNGGEHGAITPCGCPVGTSIEVRNLFFNTPVRRKFLRSTQTELGHVTEAFTRIALAAPHIHFTLRHNDRPVFELPGGEGWNERIGRFFGRELSENLIWVESRAEDMRVSGFAAHPGQNRSHNRMQYLFLNGRAIRDRSLQHALSEAYRGLILQGRFPIAFLMLDMPPELVDVNVHPTKMEVRFQDSGRLYSQLLSTLRSKFLTSDLSARATVPPSQGSAQAHDAEQARQVQQELADWAKGKISTWEAPAECSPGEIVAETATGTDDLARTIAMPSHLSAVRPPALPLRREPLPLVRLERNGNMATVGQNPGSRALGSEPHAERERSFGDPGAPVSGATRHHADPSHAPSPIQIHNRYLVAETEEGMVIIDQHALHERILFEKLRRRIDSGAIESQSLLVPEPVDLSPTEAAAALEHRETLAKLGLRIEPFGGDTVLVSSAPAILRKTSPGDTLRAILEPIMAGGKTPDLRDLLDDLLHTVACKAAVKAGDRLSGEEIASLVAQRGSVADSHHCPHGRPTELLFTREELDKQFKRV